MSEEKYEAVPMPPGLSFVPSEELQKAIASATKTITGRTFSQRHPELGKMVNCQFCGRRHRAIQELRTHGEKDGVKRASKFVGTVTCSQVFTSTIGDFAHEQPGSYEMFREDENGELVPDYRTSIRPDEGPTKRQMNGTLAFKGRRLRPHFSKFNLQLIERTRQIFEARGFATERAEKQTPDEFTALLHKSKAVARSMAEFQLKQEMNAAARMKQKQQDLSRRINRGLL